MNRHYEDAVAMLLAIALVTSLGIGGWLLGILAWRIWNW